MLVGVLRGHMAQRYAGSHQDFCCSCGNIEECITGLPFLGRSTQFLAKPIYDKLGSLANVSLNDLALFLDRTGWLRKK